MNTKLQGKARQQAIDVLMARCTIGGSNALFDLSYLNPDKFYAICAKVTELKPQGDIFRADVDKAVLALDGE